MRLRPELIDRLDCLAHAEGMNRSELAQTLLDEGIRMAEHPGIVFRPGPAGRRPGLQRGPDVWEVVSVFRELEETGEDAILQTARLTGLHSFQVHQAVDYYLAYRDEIDQWIDQEREEAEQAEDAWRRKQELLRA
jgi:hypothetical protein